MNVFISLLPVFVFLIVLVYLDSYKLIKLRWVIVTIAVGAGLAIVALFINAGLLENTSIRTELYARYIAPAVEEILKALPVLYLVRSKRTGFMVDAAIYGFAVGAGFAFVENIYYLNTLDNPNLLLWMIRGFGTAVMHGGTTAIVGIVSKNIADRFPERAVLCVLPPVAVAYAIHSGFNHFLLPPIVETIVLLIVLPSLLYMIFLRSEESTKKWLGVGLDADMEVLHVLSTGNLSGSPIGLYLQSLREKFPATVIVDMLCLLRIHTELALRSKGILMMREAGFATGPDPEVIAKFEELKYLEKSIGATGKMAMLPVLHTSSRDLWQIYMLK